MQIVANDKFRLRLREVVEFLAGHLDQPPRLGSLAEIASMSPYHFLRVYARHMGETPMATSRRLRLNRAWQLLAKGNAVGDVARATGYGSSQAFSNAFRDRFGIPPSKVPINMGLPALPPHIERLEALPLMAIPHRGTMVEAVLSFDGLFQRFHRAGHRVDLGQIYGIVHDASELMPERNYNMQVSVVSPARLTGLDDSRLPGGTYVVVRSISEWPMATEADMARITRAAWAAGYERTQGPLLARPVVDPYRTAPGDRLWELLHPVRAARSTMQ